MDTHSHHGHSHGSPISFTGERVLPGEPGWEWCYEAHRFGYQDLVYRIDASTRVIDIGCGEGYGAAALAEAAAFVVACDYSAEAVAHARQKYARPNMAFVVCDAQRLPFRENSADVVSSLQVIEHFTDTSAHLAGVALALRPDGFHYCATPNIAEMSPDEADNEYHLRDFTAPQLAEAMGERFGTVEILGMFYREDSPRVKVMRAAEARFEKARPRLRAIESIVGPLPGPIRPRARNALRALLGVAGADADAARNAIVANDFEARPPAEESFCLIAVARAPRT